MNNKLIQNFQNNNTSGGPSNQNKQLISKNDQLRQSFKNDGDKSCTHTAQLTPNTQNQKTQLQSPLINADDLVLPKSVVNGQKIISEKYMVLQMGQNEDDKQDQELIKFLS